MIFFTVKFIQNFLFIFMVLLIRSSTMKQMDATHSPPPRTTTKQELFFFFTKCEITPEIFVLEIIGDPYYKMQNSRQGALNS